MKLDLWGLGTDLVYYESRRFDIRRVIAAANTRQVTRSENKAANAAPVGPPPEMATTAQV